MYSAPIRTRRIAVATAALALTVLPAGLAACRTAADAPAAGRAGAATDAPPALVAADELVPIDEAIDAPGLSLENVWRMPNDVISGSAPATEADLGALATLGVRTIVCVDGLAPDAAAARARGMRVVHLPIRYAEVDASARAGLVRAFDELPRPLYIHCHHGKHRGPAAAAWALVSCGEMRAEDGRAVLELLGTSPRYPGLYRDVAEAHRWTPLERAVAGAAELPERARVGGPVRQMAEISRLHEHLQAIERAGWRTPERHPDLVPASEAAMLRDRFRDLVADASWADRPADFRAMLVSSEAAALELERALDRPEPDVARAADALARITADCTACHDRWRNAPEG